MTLSRLRADCKETGSPLRLSQLVAMRYENWKFVFCEQRVEGTLRYGRSRSSACAYPGGQ